MELSVVVCSRVEEEEKPGLRGWLQKWWGAQGGPATLWLRWATSPSLGLPNEDGISLLPMNTLLETLHRDRRETRYRLRFFWLVLVAIFFWELLPEYTMSLLTGLSAFCLAKQDSLVITNVSADQMAMKALAFCPLVSTGSSFRASRSGHLSPP